MTTEARSAFAGNRDLVHLEAHTDRAGHPGRAVRAEVVCYAVLAAAILWPLRREGFALLLDWTPTPFPSVNVEGPFGIHDAPLDALLALASRIVPMWLLQRVILFGTLVAAGTIAARTAPVTSRAARLVAGVVYLINPFTMTRLAAGHWRFLVAYAVAPFAVRAIVRLASDPVPPAGVRAGLWVAGMAAISAHFLLLVVVVVVAFPLALLRHGSRAAATFIRCAAVMIAATAWWAIPALMIGAPEGGGYESIDVFRTHPHDGSSVFVTTLGLRGFWLARLAMEPSSWIVVTYGLLACAAVGAARGARDHRRPLVLALIGSMSAAIVIAVGVASPTTEPLARALYRTIPGALIFREPQKLLALVALGYAWLGAIAVDRRPSSVPRRRRALLPFAVAVVPLVAMAGSLRPIHDVLTPVRYPASWQQADALLRTHAPTGGVVALPWQMYHPLPFHTHGLAVASPLEDFFRAPLITSDDPQIFDRSPHADPRRRALDVIFSDPRGRRISDELASLGIGFVVLIPQTDPNAYSFLLDDPRLDVMLATNDIVVLRNRAAVDRSPSASEQRAVRLRPSSRPLVKPAQILAVAASSANRCGSGSDEACDARSSELTKE